MIKAPVVLMSVSREFVAGDSVTLSNIHKKLNISIYKRSKVGVRVTGILEHF